MLGVLVYVILFSLVYLAYRWIKQKIYTYRGIGPLDESKERYLFLTCLYVFIFISTWRFTFLSPSGIGVSYRGTETYLIPFSEIIETNRMNIFFEFLSGDERMPLSLLIKDYLFTFAQTMIILLPLSLSLFAAYENHLKRFVWLLVTIMGSYYFSGDLLVGSTIIKVIFLYGLTYLIYWLIDKLFARRKIIIWLSIFIMLVGVVFTSDIRIVNDSYTSSYKAPETIDFEAPYTSHGDVDFSFHSAKLKEDHTEIEFEYTLNKIPELNMPYEYKFLSMTLDLKTGENSFKYGFSQGNSLIINNVDNTDGFRSKSVFPLTIYGISEIMYVLIDPDLLEQISFEDGGWLSGEPYTCYRFTYRIPKITGYELSWNLPLKYNDLKDQTFNPKHSYYTKSRILEETEASVLYEVKNYFYDRDTSDIEILGPEIINVIYGMVFEIDKNNPILHFENAEYK